MTNRFPLILNQNTGHFEEIASGDNLDLTGTGIVNADTISANIVMTDNLQYANGQPYSTGGGSAGNAYSTTDYSINVQTTKNIHVTQLTDNGGTMANSVAYPINGYVIEGYPADSNSAEIDVGWTVTGTQNGSPITVTVTNISSMGPNANSVTLSDYIDLSLGGSVTFTSPPFYNAWVFDTNGTLTLPTTGSLKLSGGASNEVLITDGSGNLSFIKTGSIHEVSSLVRPTVNNINRNYNFGPYGAGYMGSWSGSSWSSNYIMLCVSSVNDFITNFNNLSQKINPITQSTMPVKLKIVDSVYLQNEFEFTITGVMDVTNWYGYPVVYLNFSNQSSKGSTSESYNHCYYYITTYHNELLNDILDMDISKVSIYGGSTGQYLQTDGFGKLSWSGISSINNSVNVNGSITAQQIISPTISNSVGIPKEMSILTGTSHYTNYNPSYDSGYYFGDYPVGYQATDPSPLKIVILITNSDYNSLLDSNGLPLFGDSLILTSNQYLSYPLKLNGLSVLSQGGWSDGVSAIQLAYTSVEPWQGMPPTDNTIIFSMKALKAEVLDSDISLVHISGGASGQALTTDGSGNLGWSWVNTMPTVSSGPSPATTGMMVVSDGISWDPESDGLEHLMVYLNGSWTKVA